MSFRFPIPYSVFNERLTKMLLPAGACLARVLCGCKLRPSLFNLDALQYIYSSLAQSVERMTVNHDVVGSSPTGGARKKHLLRQVLFSMKRTFGV